MLLIVLKVLIVRVRISLGLELVGLRFDPNNLLSY